MNRAERRQAARQMVHRTGSDGKKHDAESTRRVRAKIADAMKSPLHEQEAIGTKPRVLEVDEDTGITESGLLVPAQADEGLIVP